MAEQLSELIKKNQKIYDYCEKIYLDAWKNVNVHVDETMSDTKKEEIRREAQRNATDKALISCLAKFADDDSVPEDLLWSLIGAAHKYTYAHLQDFGLSKEEAMEAYDRCISAHQSWIKTSGHTFERYMSNITSTEMKDNEIEFLLEKDILKRIKDGKLANDQSDIEKISKWAENFDLYAVQTIHKKTHVFGCIQMKTSIRDRVGRDDQFSKLAMESNFWVAEAVLNGAFFKLPKYYHMVNGGSETYPTNNWNGVYVMSGINKTDGRIYKDDDSFSLMASHAVQAAEQFTVLRSKLNRDWKAK